MKHKIISFLLFGFYFHPVVHSQNKWESQHHEISVQYKSTWRLDAVIDSTDLAQAWWIDDETGYTYILEKYRPTPFMIGVSDKIWYQVFINQFLKNLENTSFIERKSVMFRSKPFEQLTFQEKDELNEVLLLAKVYIRRTKEWVYKIYFIYSAQEEEIPEELLEINDAMKWK